MADFISFIHVLCGVTFLGIMIASFVYITDMDFIMNILITGGNGFVAREIIIGLLSQDHSLTVCVRKLSDCVLFDGQ